MYPAMQWGHFWRSDTKTTS